MKEQYTEYVNTLFGEGKPYKDLADYGEKLKNALRTENCHDCDNNVIELFTEPVARHELSGYAVTLGDSELAAALGGAENRYLRLGATKDEQKEALFELAYAALGTCEFVFNAITYGTISEFAEYLRCVSRESYNEFSKLCAKLVTKSGGLAPEFEAWLRAQGAGDKLLAWREKLFK